MDDGELRAYDMKGAWCAVHMSVRHEEDASSCSWDLLLGPRIGRGVCTFTNAVVTYYVYQEDYEH